MAHGHVFRPGSTPRTVSQKENSCLDDGRALLQSPKGLFWNLTNYGFQTTYLPATDTSRIVGSAESYGPNSNLDLWQSHLLFWISCKLAFGVAWSKRLEHTQVGSGLTFKIQIGTWHIALVLVLVVAKYTTTYFLPQKGVCQHGPHHWTPRNFTEEGTWILDGFLLTCKYFIKSREVAVSPMHNVISVMGMCDIEEKGNWHLANCHVRLESLRTEQTYF